MIICVVATSPALDTSVVCGPYRSYEAARAADEILTAKGYNTEVCEMINVREIKTSGAWDREEGGA